jgi:hypothetical protein
MKVVHWFVDGRHCNAEDPHKSHSNARNAREEVGAICENWWPSHGDYPLNFDVVITAPAEWAGRYPVEVESIPNFIIGKAS